jgi:hypothetical protein
MSEVMAAHDFEGSETLETRSWRRTSELDAGDNPPLNVCLHRGDTDASPYADVRASFLPTLGQLQ